MPEAENTSNQQPAAPFREEWARLWSSLPSRWLVVALIGLWVALFHFLGNSTLGYVETRSLFGWFWWTRKRSAGADDEHGNVQWAKLLNDEEFHAWLIPLVVAVLLWIKREEIIALTKRVCWPALGIIAAGLLIHFIGYLVQQGRLSVLGFFVGIYGFTGLFWGGAWLRLSMFPFALFGFCVPMGTGIEALTFPLRMLATKLTAVFCEVGLGIDLVCDGTQISDAAGGFHFEVAAACSGIRSLTAISAMSVIFGYLTFKSFWRRSIMVASAIPLAVIGNVFRLTLIVAAGKAFSQKAGEWVHESTLLGLAPYVPAIGGMVLLGWWLREDRKPRVPAEPVLMTGAEIKS